MQLKQKSEQKLDRLFQLTFIEKMFQSGQLANQAHQSIVEIKSDQSELATRVKGQLQGIMSIVGNALENVQNNMAQLAQMVYTKSDH